MGLWERVQFMRRINGTPECELDEPDYVTFSSLEREGKALLVDGAVSRIPLSYGDGKKSPYGVTYADELTGEFA